MSTRCTTRRRCWRHSVTPVSSNNSRHTVTWINRAMASACSRNQDMVRVTSLSNSKLTLSFAATTHDVIMTLHNFQVFCECVDIGLFGVIGLAYHRWLLLGTSGHVTTAATIAATTLSTTTRRSAWTTREAATTGSSYFLRICTD